MEPLAYLYLAQEYESSEIQEFVFLQNLGASIAPLNFTRLKRSGKATLGLISAVSATWMLSAPTVALAEGSVEFVPIILGGKYVKSYAGGGYYYILEDNKFEDQTGYAVIESSYSSGAYYPVGPEPAPSQPLCGVFKEGDSGSGVACLQELLQKAGYFDGAITGYFGPKTCDAVIAFQRDHGLFVDGVAGPQTLEVLNQIAGTV